MNRSIPEGSLAAGSPCKVIKENYYPKNLSKEEIGKLVEEILVDWNNLITHKVGDTVDFFVSYSSSEGVIELKQKDKLTYYNVLEKTVDGYQNNLSEDLRDYLRRRGIKIYTENNFKSI